MRRGPGLAAAALLIGGAWAVLATGQQPRSPAAFWILFDPAAEETTAPRAISAEAEAQRARLGITDLHTDRPVDPALIRAVENAGARIRHASRWLRGVSVDADPRTIDALRSLPFVREIRPAGSETPVYLRSDEDVPYGFVVRVMGEIKEGGVDDLSLVVEPEARSGS